MFASGIRGGTKNERGINEKEKAKPASSLKTLSGTYLICDIKPLRMYDLFRDSVFGQILRLVGWSSVATYPEDAADFQLHESYTQSNCTLNTSTYNLVSGEERPGDPEKAERVNQKPPQQLEDGITLVTWYSETDEENPHNWSSAKKAWVSILILIYTFSVYIGSSLYTASESDIVSIYGVSEVAAALGLLSLYVIGYGVGPMLFSPLSEISAIGRNPPYVITYALFVILCVPTSLVNNLWRVVGIAVVAWVFWLSLLGYGRS